MKYFTISETAKKWGVSEQSIRAYCSHGQIDGVIKNGNKYRIPANAIKPLDGRNLRAKTYKSSYAKMFITADTLKKEFLNPSLPVCVDDSRLYSDFLAEYIYNSNAFEGNSLTLLKHHWSSMENCSDISL